MQSISNIDPNVAQFLSRLGDIVTWPFEQGNQAINQLQHLPLEEKRRYETGLPTLADITIAFKTYHFQILKSSSEWSEDVKNGTEWFAMKVFYPLSFTHIGDAIRITIARKILGNLAKAVSFAAFQIFHSIPWLMIISAFSGIHFLYIVAPVELLTAFAGTALFIFYRLVKEIELTNKILDDNLSIISTQAEWSRSSATSFAAKTKKFCGRALLTGTLFLFYRYYLSDKIFGGNVNEDVTFFESTTRSVSAAFNSVFCAPQTIS